MSLNVDVVLIVCALVCFGAKFVGAQTKLDLVSGGFMFLTATLLPL